jgi:hypothetical protein
VHAPRGRVACRCGRRSVVLVDRILTQRPSTTGPGERDTVGCTVARHKPGGAGGGGGQRNHQRDVCAAIAGTRYAVIAWHHLIICT